MSVRAASGWAALALFLGMAGWISVAVAPVTGVAPQAVLGMSDARLAEFGLALSRANLSSAYRGLVLLADSAFIACFALWVARSLSGLLGAGVALVYVVIDLGENYVLLSHFLLQARDLTGWVLYLPEETGTWAPVAYLTAAKLGMVVSLTIGIVARELRQRRTK